MNKSSNNKRIFFYVLLFLFLVFQCIVAVKHSWDLECYIRASKRILDGFPLYIREGIPYVYPPFFAFAMIPLSFLNTIILKTVWFLLSLFVLYYAVFLLIKLIPKDYKNTFNLYFFPLAFSLRFIMDNFALGQVNILIMFIVVLILYFFINGKDFYAGLLLGMCISIKLTPLLLLVYFVYKREFKVALYAIISIIIFMLMPSAAIGFSENIQCLSQYFHIIGNFTDTTVNNQSLFITIKRLLSPIPPWDNLYINIANFGEFHINMITFFIFGVIAIYLGYLFKDKIENRKESNILYEYSIIVICILLFSPLSRKAHFIFLLIPHFFLFYYIFVNNRGTKLIKYLLVISLILNSLTSELPVQIFAFIYNLPTSGNLNGRDLSDVFESFSCVTIGTALLFAGLCAAIFYTNKTQNKSNNKTTKYTKKD